MIHPKRRDIIDQDKESIFYLLEEFRTQAADLPIECVCQLIGGILNRTEKAVGYPAPMPVPPCPDFEPADELAKPEKIASDSVQTRPPIDKPKSAPTPPEPPYDREHLTWLRCPNDVGHETKTIQTKRGKTQICDVCDVWLNPDGTMRPRTKMDDRGSH